MNTMIYFVFSSILIYGTISAKRLDKNTHTERKTISNDNLKTASVELTTEIQKIKVNGEPPDLRSETSTIIAEDVIENLRTPKTDEANNSESFSDFDDLEYRRNANTAEYDFVDEEGDETEPDKFKISDKTLNEDETQRKERTELNKDTKSYKIETSSSSLIPVIDAAVRAGEILKFAMDDDDRSRSSSNENSEVINESNVAYRRMFNHGNHEDQFEPDYTHHGPVQNSHKFDRYPSQPYHSTTYPNINGYLIPYNSYPAAQNSNPYNMNKSSRSHEYRYSNENSNNYPYLDHSNKRSLLPYNMYGNSGQDHYRRLLNSYSNPYSNTHNYGIQPFGHGRYV